MNGSGDKPDLLTDLPAAGGLAERPAALETHGPTNERGKPHYAGHRDRLRQRFFSAGAAGLADYEILELLLFAAIPRRDVKPLAKQLLTQFGSLGGVLRAAPEQLSRRSGLGPAAVAALSVVAVAAERMLREEVLERPVLSSWQRLLDYLQVAMQYENAEQVRLLFLDRKNVLIADEVQQRGTVDHAPVYPREVIKRAIALDASALILVHNHPSGDATPSHADIEMTRQIIEIGKPLSIVVHDHLVVGREKVASFKQLGLM